MTSNDVLEEDIHNDSYRIIEENSKNSHLLSTPKSKTSLKTQSLSKHKKSKRRDCTPDSPPDSHFSSYSVFWSQLKSKNNGNDKYIEPKCLFTEPKGENKFFNSIQDSIIEEKDKEDKLFKNLFSKMIKEDSYQEDLNESNNLNRITEKIKAIIINMNEKHLNIIHPLFTKIVLIDQSLNSSIIKPNEFKEIFVNVEPDFSEMISLVESNCFILKSKLFLNSSNQVKIYNGRFLFSFMGIYDELILSEIEVHLM